MTTTMQDWAETKRRLQARWPALREEELDASQGDRSALIALLQTRLGYAQENAEQDLDQVLRGEWVHPDDVADEFSHTGTSGPVGTGGGEARGRSPMWSGMSGRPQGSGKGMPMVIGGVAVLAGAVLLLGLIMKQRQRRKPTRAEQARQLLDELSEKMPSLEDLRERLRSLEDLRERMPTVDELRKRSRMLDQAAEDQQKALRKR